MNKNTLEIIRLGLTSHWVGILLVSLIGILLGWPMLRLIERYGNLSQSFFWPIRSHCFRCLTPIPLFQRFPFIGPITYGCRCQGCGHWFGTRPIYLPIMTMFAVLIPYVLWVACQARFQPTHRHMNTLYSIFPEHQFALFIYHAIFFLLLLAAMWTDFDWFLIPDSITIPGMIIGLVLGTFWYVELHPIPVWPGFIHPSQYLEPQTLKETFFKPTDEMPSWLYLEKYWPDLYYHWRMNWNRYMGFTNSILGLVIGGGMTYLVRAIVSAAFRKEALGFGDVIFFMMIGTFLGWQACVIIFCTLAPISAVVFFVVQTLIKALHAAFTAPSFWKIPATVFDRLWNSPTIMPYGPHLAIGAYLLVIFWNPIWKNSFDLFAIDFFLFVKIVVGMLIALFFSAAFVQMTKSFLTNVTNEAR